MMATMATMAVVMSDLFTGAGTTPEGPGTQQLGIGIWVTLTILQVLNKYMIVGILGPMGY